MKPSPLDVDSTDSDVEPEDFLSHRASYELQTSMVNMMLNLGDKDLGDADWLPLEEQKKLLVRKKGVISLC
jgi:hypothetical protein